MSNEMQQQFDIDKADLGMPTEGRPVTATLYVCADGDDSDGSSWEHAYTTPQGALDVASAGVDELDVWLQIQEI